MCSLAPGAQVICLSWSLGVSLVHDNTHKENCHLLRVAMIGLLHPWGVHGPDMASGPAHEGHLLCTLCQLFSISLMSIKRKKRKKEMFCSSRLSWGHRGPAATQTVPVALHHFLYRAVCYQCSRWGEQSQVHSTLGFPNPKGRFCRGANFAFLKPVSLAWRLV